MSVNVHRHWIKRKNYFLHGILIVILLYGNLHQDAMPRYLWEAKNPVAMSWGWCNRSACSFLFRAGATLPLSYPHLTTVWGGTAGNWIALSGNCSCSKLYKKKRKEKKPERGTNRFLQHIIKCKGNWTEDSALWNTAEEICISGLDTSVPCTVWLNSFCPQLHCWRH